MRLALHLLLVLMLAFALSGAQALAAPACCMEECVEDAGHPEDSGTPEHRESERCPPACHACPCARVVAPVPSLVPELPGPTAPVLVGWMEPPGAPGRLSSQDIFQPPRA